MRILVTNLRMERFSGSEAAAEHLVDGLRRAGHETAVFAPALGPQAEQMRTRGHVVVDRLCGVPFRPDVIHAQHTTPSIMAMTAFPHTPLVSVCHSARFAQEAPLIHPQVRRYVAVDELCRERCLADGAPPDRLSVLLNPVDLERFLPRPPLPPRPRRALMLSKTVDQRKAIAAACTETGIELEELGPGAKRVSRSIESELGRFDIVFATARMALEAAAVGCAVVVVDARGLAGLLTSESFAAWRPHNLGAKILSQPVTRNALVAAIGAYDTEDAAEVSRAVRRSADLALWTQDMLAIYGEAIAEGVPGDRAALAMASAALLEEWLPSPTARSWRTMVTEKHLAPEETNALIDAQNAIHASVEHQRQMLKQLRAHVLKLTEAASANPTEGAA